MTVKPTDLRVLIPKSQELSRTEQVREKQDLNNQQFHAAQQQQQVERELQQVQFSPEAYQAMIRAKEERQRRQEKKEEKTTKNANKAGKAAEDVELNNVYKQKKQNQHNHIDIRL